MNKQELLDRFARRLAGESDFIAELLEAYRTQEQLDESQLAARLSLDTVSYTRLALCRPPRPDHFAADIQRLVDITGADPIELTRVIRQIAAVVAFQQMSAHPPEPHTSAQVVGGRHVLAAARDREETDSTTQDDLVSDPPATGEGNPSAASEEP